MSLRQRILLSAYSCAPGAGSEPGIGWNTALQLARFHDVWVLTRANNRTAIDRELLTNPRPGLAFVYCDLPGWLRRWKKGGRGVQVYYYLWQLWIEPEIKRQHKRLGFDTVQHITFGRYWTPSLLAGIGVPFVWGPVGGGDSVPASLRPMLSGRGAVLNKVRTGARWLGEHDPLVRSTARGSRVALATTPATAARMKALGARDVRLLAAAALPDSEIELLGELGAPAGDRIRFVSIGNLIYWKTFDLGLRAFAEANVPDSEYLIVGDGPELNRLMTLCKDLGIDDRVKWLGRLPREQVLKTLEMCHALVHPSLHDSGGWVCLEAMAAGRPVICLDLAGPSFLVSPSAGVRVPTGSVDSVIQGLANAMRLLARAPEVRRRMGAEGRSHVRSSHSWNVTGDELHKIHVELSETDPGSGLP